MRNRTRVMKIGQLSGSWVNVSTPLCSMIIYVCKCGMLISMYMINNLIYILKLDSYSLITNLTLMLIHSIPFETRQVVL